MKARAIVASAVLAFAVSHLAVQPALAQVGKNKVPLTTTTALNLEVTGSTVTVRGITPHGTVVIFAVIRVPQRYVMAIARHEYTFTDVDGDGVVQVANLVIPVKSVWFAADITTGAYALSTLGQEQLRRLDLAGNGVVHNALGEVKRIAVARTFVEGLVVRPGVGVWGFSAGDGGQLDADGVVNGRVEVDPLRMRPMGSSPAAPDQLLSRDILVIVDPNTQQLFASEVEP